MTEVPMERYLRDMPYEILFEICRELHRGKLLEISRFPSKFGNVARDARLWKDVYIRYNSSWKRWIFDFEELYSGPFPVKVIDLSHTIIYPPVSFEPGQVVKVTRLNWRSSKAEKATIEAVLAKYQCKELHLDYTYVIRHDHIMGIAPEAFSMQTNLDVLSLRDTLCSRVDVEMENVNPTDIHQWLATVLSKYCKNLRSLDLSYNILTGLDSAFVKSLPTSLEKLCLISDTCPENVFFGLLAKRLPNLKEIGLRPERVECPALLEFKFLETLHIIPYVARNIPGLYKYLIRFPALKNVHIDIDDHVDEYHSLGRFIEALRTKLNSHGIAIDRKTRIPEYPTDSNLWEVSDSK